MAYEQILTMLNENDYTILPKFYQFMADEKTKNCKECLKYAGKIFEEHDPLMPALPLHPHCDCYFKEVNLEKYLKQKNFEFGNMTHEEWSEQALDEKYLWCNAFREKFGNAIDDYSKKYNIPKQLLAGVIANEMLDWRFPDGTILDGIRGGGIGYAQIAYSTAKKHGIQGAFSEIRKLLNSYEGSVKIAAKILSDYLTEFKESQKSGKLGDGFLKSILYYQGKSSILNKGQLENIQVRSGF